MFLPMKNGLKTGLSQNVLLAHKRVNIIYSIYFEKNVGLL